MQPCARQDLEGFNRGTEGQGLRTTENVASYLYKPFLRWNAIFRPPGSPRIPSRSSDRRLGGMLNSAYWLPVTLEAWRWF